MSGLTFFFEAGSSYLPMEQVLKMQQAFCIGLGFLIGYVIPKIVVGRLPSDQVEILELIRWGLKKYLENVDLYIQKLASIAGLENVQYISQLDFANVIELLGWLGPFISTHASVLAALTTLLDLLRWCDSPLVGTLNHLCDRMKGNGVVLMEYYRAFEDLVGIQISDSRFPLQD